VVTLPGNSNQTDIPLIANRRRIVFSFFLVLATLTALAYRYLPTLKLPFSYDDYHLLGILYKHPTMAIDHFWSGTGAGSGFFRPFVSLIYSTILNNFGASQEIFRIVQLVMHLVNCVLIFLIASRVFKLKLLWALSAACLFALHPLNPESITWIAAYHIPLGVMAYLTCLFVGGATDFPISNSRLFVVLVIFALGLMCSELLITLPGVLAVIWIYRSGKNPLRDKELLLRITTNVTAFALLLAGYFILRYNIFGALVYQGWSDSYRFDKVLFVELPSTVFRLLFPYNPRLDTSSVLPKLHVMFFLFAILATTFSFIKYQGARRRIATISVSAILVLIPTYNLLRLWTNLFHSRFFYLFSALLIVLLMSAFETLAEGKTKYRGLIIFPIILGIAYFYLLGFNLRNWTTAGREVMATQTELNRLAETHEEAAIYLANFPIMIDGVLTLSRHEWHLAMSPPFNNVRVPISTIKAERDIMEKEAIRLHPNHETPFAVYDYHLKKSSFYSSRATDVAERNVEISWSETDFTDWLVSGEGAHFSPATHTVEGINGAILTSPDFSMPATAVSGLDIRFGETGGEGDVQVLLYGSSHTGTTMENRLTMVKKANRRQIYFPLRAAGTIDGFATIKKISLSFAASVLPQDFRQLTIRRRGINIYPVLNDENYGSCCLGPAASLYIDSISAKGITFKLAEDRDFKKPIAEINHPFPMNIKRRRAITLNMLEGSVSLPTHHWPRFRKIFSEKESFYWYAVLYRNSDTLEETIARTRVYKFDKNLCE
jgi:hypothetical protein